MANKNSFIEYYQEVSEHIKTHLGFSADDIEFDFFSCYEQGMGIEDAAKLAVDSAEPEDC